MTVDFTSPWPWVGIAVLVAVMRCGAWLRREIRNAGPDMDPLPTCPEVDDKLQRVVDDIERFRRRHSADHPACIVNLDQRRNRDRNGGHDGDAELARGADNAGDGGAA